MLISYDWYRVAAAASARGSSAGPALVVPPVAPMHIPDGFLSLPVSLLLWACAVAGVAYALMRVNRDLDERKVPLMGVMAAAIFAGQMLNFTVAGGTSGHLMGAALAAIVLGPWAAVVVMACVVGTQALLFQDGGLLALGANITNMGLVGICVGLAVYYALRRLAGTRGMGVILAGFAAGWASVVVAALFVALQLGASGTSPANIAVPAMGGIHMLIGVGEGLITAGALALLQASRPDILLAGQAQASSSRGLVVGGLAVALVLAVLSPLASAFPDGLEWVAEQQGFIHTAQDAPYSIIPDYVAPGISSESLATIVAGILGVVIVFAIAWLVGVSRRSREVSQSH